MVECGGVFGARQGMKKFHPSPQNLLHSVHDCAILTIYKQMETASRGVGGRDGMMARGAGFAGYGEV